MMDIDKSRSTAMDDKKAADEGQETAYQQNSAESDVGIGIDDAAAIPKGEIDPVYEAKARVLNRAVSWESVFQTDRPSCGKTDQAHMRKRSRTSVWDGINGELFTCS